jgi:hypothetical protein
MPKDFSQDGAAGATSGPPQGAAGTLGPSVMGVGMNPAWLNTIGNAGLGGPARGNATPNAAWEGDALSEMTPGSPNYSAMFEDGGVVPDQDDAGAGANPASGDPTSGTGDPISLALTTVDNALAYGRKLNGLPSDGGGGSAQPQQMAANMPMAPAGQSETGIKPPLPAPGRLPPTSNPFGKRTPLKIVGDNEPGDGDSTPKIPDDDDEETA